MTNPTPAPAAGTAAHRLIAEGSPDLHTVTDEDGVYRFVSPSSRSLFGWAPSELEGQPATAFVHPDDLEPLLADRLDPLDPSASPLVVSRFRHSDGSFSWVETLSNHVTVDGKRVVVSAVREISARFEAEIVLRREASTDPLTGLANRTLFIDRLQQALRRLGRRDGLVAVLLLDLDRFKFVNDTAGHPVGDSVLLQVAERLRGFLRPQDTLARLGGDEFALVVEDLSSPEEVMVLADRIVAGCRAGYVVGRDEFVNTMSLGIAVTSDSDRGVEVLLKEADLALYRAKDRGRDCAEMFDEELRTVALERLSTERMLRAAIGAGRLRVDFQPIIDLRSWRTVAAEALVRVVAADEELLQAESFIEVAASTGLLPAMDEYVLESALRQSAAWRELAVTDDVTSVAVNLTARHLAEPGFAQAIVDGIEAHDLATDGLRIELTERELTDATDAALEGLARLRSVGVMVGLDNFGAGYSSLSHLRLFPLDFVKLDRSFIRELTAGAGERAIVGSLIDTCHALGLSVVATGVETQSQLDDLVNLGCDLAQGFLFAPPGEAAMMEEFLRRSPAPRVVDTEPVHTVALPLPHVEPTTRATLTDLRVDVRDVSLAEVDVLETHVEEADRYHDASHDPLTGLANRAAFRDQTARAIERHRRDGAEVMVISVELQGLRSTQASHGHVVTGLLLNHVAHQVESSVRPADTVARVGEGQFAVLSESPEAAARMAARISRRLGDSVVLGAQKVLTDVRIDVRVAGASGTPDPLPGRSVASTWRPDPQRSSAGSPGSRPGGTWCSELGPGLEGAAGRGELHVYYQPIVGLATGHPEGFEALVRWDHPELGRLEAAEFIDLAEQSGAIVPIGAWVLRLACHQAHQWRKTFGRELTMSVNLSARQLRDPGLVGQVETALREANLDPSALVLEITETATAQDAELVYSRLGELRELGVRLAVDGLGTGHVSPAGLRLPVARLKIARPLIAGLVGSGAGDFVVASVINLAHALGVEVVAEGVETVQQLERLSGMNCDFAQGYNWSPPAGAGELRAWLGMIFQPDSPEGRSSSRVLLVDDVASVRAALRIAIEIDDRFSVVGEAGDGGSAVRQAEALLPDLIVLDVRMPGAGGLQAVPQLRAAAPGAAIVLLTALDVASLDPRLAGMVDACYDKAKDLSSLVESLGVVAGRRQVGSGVDADADGVVSGGTVGMRLRS